MATANASEGRSAPTLAAELGGDTGRPAAEACGFAGMGPDVAGEVGGPTAAHADADEDELLATDDSDDDDDGEEMDSGSSAAAAGARPLPDRVLSIDEGADQALAIRHSFENASKSMSKGRKVGSAKEKRKRRRRRKRK